VDRGRETGHATGQGRSQTEVPTRLRPVKGNCSARKPSLAPALDLDAPRPLTTARVTQAGPLASSHAYDDTTTIMVKGVDKKNSGILMRISLLLGTVLANCRRHLLKTIFGLQPLYSCLLSLPRLQLYSCLLCSCKHIPILPLEFIQSCHSYQETEQCNLPARKYQVVIFSFTLEEKTLEEGSVTLGQLRA